MSQLDLFSPWVRQNTSNSEIATQLHNFLLDFRALIGPLRVYVSLLTCMRICVLVFSQWNSSAGWREYWLVIFFLPKRNETTPALIMNCVVLVFFVWWMDVCCKSLRKH